MGQDRLTTWQSDTAERSVVAEWRRCLAGLAVQLVDVYRQRNPGSRTYTYTHFSLVGAARLDRFYISSPLVEWIARARVGGRLPAAWAGADSDHRPVALDLIPRPTATPAGAPRHFRGGACVALSCCPWLGWCPGNVTPLSHWVVGPLRSGRHCRQLVGPLCLSQLAVGLARSFCGLAAVVVATAADDGAALAGLFDAP